MTRGAVGVLKALTPAGVKDAQEKMPRKSGCGRSLST